MFRSHSRSDCQSLSGMLPRHNQHQIVPARRGGASCPTPAVFYLLVLFLAMLAGMMS
jgi:hypothetical protein